MINLKNIFESITLKHALCALGVLIAALLIFWLGITVGFHKADFSYRWGENYHRNFGGPRGGFIPDRFMPELGKDFINSNGTYGKIAKIELPTITVLSDEAEKVVLIKDNTVIRRLKEEIKAQDLKLDEYIVVVGEPNDKAQIEAKLIRIMPGAPLPLKNGQ